MLQIETTFIVCVLAGGLTWGGILVMKNDDVFAVAGSSDSLSFLGTPDYAEALPKQPVKIEKLSGKGITRNKPVHLSLLSCISE